MNSETMTIEIYDRIQHLTTLLSQTQNISVHTRWVEPNTRHVIINDTWHFLISPVEIISLLEMLNALGVKHGVL